MYKMENYKNTFERIKIIKTHNPNSDFNDLLNKMALGTGVPLIVICNYLAQEYGMTDEIKKKIEELNLFYGYTRK